MLPHFSPPTVKMNNFLYAVKPVVIMLCYLLAILEPKLLNGKNFLFFFASTFLWPNAVYDVE